MIGGKKIRLLGWAIGFCSVLSAPVSAGLLGGAENFVILGLENGDVTINSATSIVGNVGYADGVTSNTNQKVDSFEGSALIHSGASVTITPATFAPTGGILSGPAIDAQLNQAHDDAVAASNSFAGLASNLDLGALGDGDDRTVNRTGVQTVISLASLNYKEDTLTIVGGVTDVFIFNVAGSFEFSASVIDLIGGVTVNNVIFNFLGAQDILINKADTLFQGTLLAPEGDVEYHNPATFNGRIIALNIDVHSDFNITAPDDDFVTIPEPSSGLLFLSGFMALIVVLGFSSKTTTGKATA